jgi:hypothetical protein
MLPVLHPQWHRVNHKQGVFVELNGHYLQRLPPQIIAEIDESHRPRAWCACGGSLLEADAVMGDDMPDALPGYAVTRSRTREVHTRRIVKASSFVGQNYP